MKSFLINTALVAVATLFAFMLGEAGSRYHLHQKFPDHFIQTDIPKSVTFFTKSIWQFDRDLGYQYAFGTRAITGTIVEGRLAGCSEVNVYDHGRVPTRGKTEGAALRVFVFGDSVTAMGVNGRSWPDYLRTELEERLRTKVEVVNFGLDGIGILQMFDIASRRVLESTPGSGCDRLHHG
jgi:hypothetical protein